MAVKQITLTSRPILLCLALLSIPFTTFAQITSSASAAPATASPTYNVFSAIASSTPPDPNNANSFDHNDDPGGSASNPSIPNPNTAGAAGPSQSGIYLSTAQTIAIAVVVGIIALLAVTSAILFYLAKKRQWEVRKSLRQSAKRVTTAFKAVTPVRPNFSRRDRAIRRVDPPGPQVSGGERKGGRDQSKRSGRILKSSSSQSSSPSPPRLNKTEGVDRDLEKGLGTRATVKALPRPTVEARPRASFDIGARAKRAEEHEETGATASDESNTPAKKLRWTKLFGQK